MAAKFTFTIIDLDNTISDDGWRIKRINWKKSCMLERYHIYHSSCLFDEFKNRHIIEESEHDIAIFTARPVFYREITAKWLFRNNINYSALYMRDNDDHRHSLELKRSMIDKLLKDFNIGIENIKSAFDDRH